MKNTKTIKIFLLLAFIVFAFSFAKAQELRKVNIKILGVRQTGKGEEGVAADLTVEVTNGNGRVFVDTMPLTEIDTQASARLSQEVSCDILGIDCSKYDFFYVIRGQFPMIGGPSAGAAMTVATLAALTNISVGSNVMITGTINPDGTIGSVGGLLAKAEAASKEGADVMIIPTGQETVYVEKTTILSQVPLVKETQMVPIDLVAYSKEHWNLTVVPVRTIEDAFKHATNYEIIKQKKTKKIDKQLYSKTMKNMCEDLIEKSETKLQILSENISSMKLSYSQSQEMNALLNTSEEKLNNAKKFYEDESYYSGASFAVNSLVFSTYAENLLNYYSSENILFIEKMLDELKENITITQTDFLQTRIFDDINDVESIVVAINRIMEAEKMLDNAYKDYYNKDYSSAIYYASFSQVRILTANEWANLTSFFKGDMNITFNNTRLRELSLKRISEASNTIAYAKTVSNNAFLTEAENHLESANEAFSKQDYAYALFEAVEAKAEANLAMETRGLTNETLSNKINDDIIDVEISIKSAEENGLIPLLAISYLEYANAFNETAPAQALVFLNYAKQYSKISTAIIQAMLNSNNELNPPNENYIIKPITCEANKNQLFIQAIMLFIGITIGFLYAVNKPKKRT